MRHKHVLLALLTIALGGALFYFYGGGHVPTGQRPLESLTPQNVTDIKDAFNAATGDVRVLLLLSPT